MYCNNADSLGSSQLAEQSQINASEMSVRYRNLHLLVTPTDLTIVEKGKFHIHVIFQNLVWTCRLYTSVDLLSYCALIP